MNNQITVNNLTHTYGSRRALDDVNFTVPRGEIFCLLGPNGSGKTTLFKILSTLMKPTSGSVDIFGYDLYNKSKAIRKLLGVVFQHPGLDIKLTVTENLRHHGHLYGLKGKTLKLRISELLERFGISDRSHDIVEELSGGLKKRVEIAKAMLHSPSILLLDEPSSGLDIGSRRQLSDHLSSLATTENILILLTTHVLDEADNCTRVGILDSGRLVSIGTPDELKGSITGDVVLIETTNGETLSQAIADRFDVSLKLTDNYIHIECEHGYEFVKEVVAAFPDEIQSVRVGRPTLEDIFIKLTGNPYV
ncbi:ABC transporter ATP-binding protein [Candidatus Poribacteria bacterium]|nr:ABC transporter ATP-binding protein [Candidatus Poribacteria bacterium]